MRQPKTTTDYSPDIAAALATPGGHLSIGCGGFTLHYSNGAMLSGYDCEAIKTQCIAAGLPIIDSRCVAFDLVVQPTLGGPLVAVGREPEPAPWSSLSTRLCTRSLPDTPPPAQRSRVPQACKRYPSRPNGRSRHERSPPLQLYTNH